jgi:hypothetical protein
VIVLVTVRVLVHGVVRTTIAPARAPAPLGAKSGPGCAPAGPAPVHNAFDHRRSARGQREMRPSDETLGPDHRAWEPSTPHLCDGSPDG